MQAFEVQLEFQVVDLFLSLVFGCLLFQLLLAAFAVFALLVTGFENALGLFKSLFVEIVSSATCVRSHH